MDNYGFVQFVGEYFRHTPATSFRSTDKAGWALADVLRRSAAQMDDAASIVKETFYEVLRDLLEKNNYSADVDACWMEFRVGLYELNLNKAWTRAIETGEELLTVLADENLILFREDCSAKLLVAHNRINWARYPERKRYCGRDLTLGEAIFDCLNAIGTDDEWI